MSRNKMLVLFSLIVLVASAGCTGEEATPTEVAPQQSVSADVELTASEVEVPEELADVAMVSPSTGRIIHQTKHYVMSEQGISQAELDARAACFSALALEEADPPCTDLMVQEYSRMPAPCSLNGGQATKDGYCPYVAK